MKIIKRNGVEVDFNKNNIIEAISHANNNVRLDARFTIQEIKDIAKKIQDRCKQETHIVNVNDLQEFVEDAIMEAGKYAVAKEYITYRYRKYLENRKNTTDDKILSLLNDENEEIKQENANKNPTIVSTQRDYIAGEVSKDIAKRYLIPADISKAHSEGIIHFHDTDYFAQPLHNCDLFNLEDMLQNGTVINGKKIHNVNKFSKAATITSQISAIVASSQYGGQTFTLSHLAPFVQKTREELLKFHKEHNPKVVEKLSEEELKDFIEQETLKDIKDGIKTLNYQLNTISTSNGQTPFVSVCMYLGEVADEQTKRDLALIIEETLRQRIAGMENEHGEPITQAFPKLLYILEEDNIHPDSKYYYLTELAAECTMKRMVPDYISEKVMKAWKKDKKGKGYCFPTMGCRSILSVWTEPKHDEKIIVEPGTDLKVD